MSPKRDAFPLGKYGNTPQRDAWAVEHGLTQRDGGLHLLFPGATPPGLRPSRFMAWMAWTGHYDRVLDHAELWGRGRRAVCYVAHPYEDPADDHPAFVCLRSLGATVIVRGRAERASWYRPGRTAMVEVWRPGESPALVQRPAPSSAVSTGGAA